MSILAVPRDLLYAGIASRLSVEDQQSLSSTCRNFRTALFTDQFFCDMPKRLNLAPVQLGERKVMQKEIRQHVQSVIAAWRKAFFENVSSKTNCSNLRRMALMIEEMQAMWHEASCSEVGAPLKFPIGRNLNSPELLVFMQTSLQRELQSLSDIEDVICIRKYPAKFLMILKIAILDLFFPNAKRSS